jgi:replicative DNA helicase
VTKPRLPPQDLDVEAALIGACLIRQDLLDDAVVLVTADDFYSPRHGHVWEAICALHLAGQPVDANTTADHLRSVGLHQGHQTDVMLGEFLAAAGTSTSVTKYTNIVSGLARLRALISACDEIAERAYERHGDVDEILGWAGQQIYDVAQTRRQVVEPVALGPAVTTWMEAMADQYANGGPAPGVPTGLADLDDRLAGMRPGQLITIAGRPGMGKSICGAQIAVHVASNVGLPVLMVTLEMSVDELVQRVVGATSQISLTRIRSGRLVERDWPHLSNAAGRLGDVPMYILDDAAASIATIRAQARRLSARHGLGLIVVDYLQLMTSVRSRDNRQVEVAEMSSGLKRIARDLSVPVIALAQLNRAVELRADKRPTLADLRESGAIENDSDVVIGIYRDEYYNPDGPYPGEAELLVLKQRNGPTGTPVRVVYRADTGVFGNYARGDA